MKTLNSILVLMCFALSAFAGRAIDEYVTKTASHATAATVYFEPGPRDAQLVLTDVTSDKAASVLNWRVGSTPLTILKAVPATAVTNILTTVGSGYGVNSNLVSVTAAGVITAHTSGTNSSVTNGVLAFRSTLGTNIAAADRVRELSSTYYDVTGTSSTNIVWVSDSSGVANATLYVLWASPSQVQTNTLTSYTTNTALGYYLLNFTNSWAFTPTRVYALTTNLYATTLVSDASANSITLDTTTGLAQDDWIVLTPATGGTFLEQAASDPATFIYQNQTIQAATGVALAAGDKLFILGPNIQTPVGATTQRQDAYPLRVIPVGMPARLTVDGTSAVSINAAIVKY